MTELSIEIMRERLKEAKSRPVKRSTLLSIGEWMTCVTDYFTRPIRHQDIEPRRADHHRATADG